MFVHETQLRHVLPPSAYYSSEQDRLERERLLLPGWHPVATLPELPREGDFMTGTLLGRPLLLRKMDGEVHAFLNVCAHRHCLLTSKPKGHDEHFRCQYHGWEYTKEGRTGKIPDAQSFRPFDRENARLKKFATALCGELVFVRLADEGPSLQEQLGPVYPIVAESFAPPWRRVWKWDTDYPANWKIPIENLLESYHIPSLHPKTFKNYPEEQNTDHELFENYTIFRTVEMEKWVKDGVRRTAQALGLPYEGAYTQWHVFPNLVFIGMDTFRMAKVVVPVTPKTSAAQVWVYAPYGPRRGILAWLSARINALISKDGARRVLHEDASVFEAAQRGMEASVSCGVIGRREERVWAFQDWIARRCQGPAPAVKDTAEGCAGCNGEGSNLTPPAPLP
jgi:phenylpropionate dioxygenase-like ring-hydroxylating dioxygenase large terminal subunit